MQPKLRIVYELYLHNRMNYNGNDDNNHNMVITIVDIKCVYVLVIHVQIYKKHIHSLLDMNINSNVWKAYMIKMQKAYVAMLQCIAIHLKHISSC